MSSRPQVCTLTCTPTQAIHVPTIQGRQRMRALQANDLPNSAKVAAWHVGQDPRTSRLGSNPRTAESVHRMRVSPQACHQCHAVLTSPKDPRIKRCRCPVLTGPAGRRQSRGCRSVRGLHAETSIWCPPVHGARAPTEHPKPNIIIVWMSFVDALTESHGPRTVDPQAGVRLRRSQSGACRVTSANPGSRAPTDHPWISTIPARPPRNGEWV
jgi:hypothetical protein